MIRSFLVLIVWSILGSSNVYAGKKFWENWLGQKESCSETVLSRSPKEKLDLTLEQANAVARLALTGKGEETVPIELSSLGEGSVALVHESLREALEVERQESQSVSDYIIFDASDTNVENRMKNLYRAFAQKFPQIISEDDLDENLPVSVSLSSILEKIVNNLPFEEGKPLTLMIINFVPTSSSWEPLSSWVRATQNAKSEPLNDKLNALRIIMTSQFDIADWGSAQDGFNVGRHIRISEDSEGSPRF